MVSIDPGKTTAGWASFTDGVLVNCGLIEAFDQRNMIDQLDWKFRGIKADLGVIECPSRHWRGRFKDMISVAVTVGMAASSMSMFKEIEIVSPSDWKGSRRKDVDNRYTLSLLSEDEAKMVPKNHNVIDAVGIGLWKAGRR